MKKYLAIFFTTFAVTFLVIESNQFLFGMKQAEDQKASSNFKVPDAFFQTPAVPKQKPKSLHKQRQPKKNSQPDRSILDAIFIPHAKLQYSPTIPKPPMASNGEPECKRRRLPGVEFHPLILQDNPSSPSSSSKTSTSPLSLINEFSPNQTLIYQIYSNSNRTEFVIQILEYNIFSAKYDTITDIIEANVKQTISNESNAIIVLDSGHLLFTSDPAKYIPLFSAYTGNWHKIRSDETIQNLIYNSNDRTYLFEIFNNSQIVAIGKIQTDSNCSYVEVIS